MALSDIAPDYSPMSNIDVENMNIREITGNWLRSWNVM